jgi:hypothetical protein
MVRPETRKVMAPFVDEVLGNPSGVSGTTRCAAPMAKDLR